MRGYESKESAQARVDKRKAFDEKMEVKKEARAAKLLAKEVERVAKQKAKEVERIAKQKAKELKEEEAFKKKQKDTVRKAQEIALAESAKKASQIYEAAILKRMQVDADKVADVVVQKMAEEETLKVKTESLRRGLELVKEFDKKLLDYLLFKKKDNNELDVYSFKGLTEAAFMVCNWPYKNQVLKPLWLSLETKIKWLRTHCEKDSPELKLMEGTLEEVRSWH